MAKYRVEFDNKEIKSIHPANQSTPESDTILEERIGETLFAIIDAADDNEAREKAERLQIELKTHKTKREITDSDDARKEREE